MSSFRFQRNLRPALTKAHLQVTLLEERCVPAQFTPTTYEDAIDAPSLRSAIIEANRNGQDNTIVLQGGVYALNATKVERTGNYYFGQPDDPFSRRIFAGEDNAEAGDLDITAAGHTLTIRGAGTDKTLLLGGSRYGFDRIFEVMAGVTLRLENLVIANGTALDAGSKSGLDGRGGAILSNGGNVILNNVIITNCNAFGVNGSGGAIYADGGRLELDNTVIANNKALAGQGSTGLAAASWSGGQGGQGGAAAGGGIYATNTQVTITSSTIFKNAVVGGQGGTGGLGGQNAVGLFGGSGGRGGNALGGGLEVVEGSLTLTRTQVSSNSATGGTGGQGGQGGTGRVGNTSLSGFYGGTGGPGGIGGDGQGGGLHTLNATVSISEGSFLYNSAFGGIGGPGGPGGTGGAGGRADDQNPNARNGGPGGSGGKGGMAGQGGMGQGGSLFANKGKFAISASTSLSGKATGGTGGQGGVGGSGGRGGAKGDQRNSVPGLGGDGGTGGKGATGGPAFGGGFVVFHMDVMTKIDRSTFTQNVVTAGQGGRGGTGGTGGPGPGSTAGGKAGTGGDGGNGAPGNSPSPGGFDGADSAHGGAIYANDWISLSNCTIDQNSSVQGLGGAAGDLGLQGLSDDGQRRQDGGSAGLDGVGSQIVQGGGVWIIGVPVIESCTITENSAGPVRGEGGGIYEPVNAEARIRNSIVALNRAFRSPDVTSFTSEGKNLIGADPGLAPLRANGGPTSTRAPFSFSPAINGGDNRAATSSIDQRGNRRIVGTIDLGAVETQPGEPFSGKGDPGNGLPTEEDLLRDNQTPSIPTVTPDSPQTVWVDEVYAKLLGRLAEATGRTYWVGQLASGASRAQVVAGIWNSQEHRQVLVERFYDEFLVRSADAQGLAYWMDRVRDGLDETSLARAFLTCAEYQAPHATTDAYSTALYRDVLGREPDAAGLASLRALSLVPRYGLHAVDVFLVSSEFRERLVDGYYLELLGRTSDESERGGWIRGLTSGAITSDAAVQAFLACDEFFANVTRV